MRCCLNIYTSYLESWQVKIYEIHRGLIDNGEAITVNNFKKKLKGETEHSHMIIDIFQQHISQIAHLVGKDFAAGTIDQYRTPLEHTRNFIQWKYNRADLDITKLNYEFISEYAFWLKSIRNCNHNSTMKYLANLKKIVSICIKNSWMQKDSFIGFKLTKREVNSTLIKYRGALKVV